MLPASIEREFHPKITQWTSPVSLTTCLLIGHQASVVQKVDIALHWINHYPLETCAIGFPYAYLLDRVGNWDLTAIFLRMSWWRLTDNKPWHYNVIISKNNWKRKQKLICLLFTTGMLWSYHLPTVEPAFSLGLSFLVFLASWLTSWKPRCLTLLHQVGET